MITKIKIEITGKVSKTEFKSLSALQHKISKRYIKPQIEFHFKNPVPNHYLNFKSSNNYTINK